MSMYSTLEGTSSLPEVNGLPNVSQYGWTAFEIENYQQLGDYVDQCKAYFDGIEANTHYIKTMYDAIFAIKGQVDIIFNTINTQANTIREQYDTINGWYNQIGLWENSIRAMQIDVTNKYNEVIQMTTQISLVGIEVQKMHDAVMISEANAKASEVGAENWFKRSYDLYLDLQKQQVYRGLWNPNSGAYPDGEGTNSYWDVILNPNQEQFEYDGKIWYFGDRLVYVLATNKFEQLEAGLSNVKSVNGKTGAVTLVAGDVDAYTKAETDAKLILKSDITYVDDKLDDKADKSTSINGKFLTGDVVLNPEDVNAISRIPVAVPSTVTVLTDRSIISANTILSLSSAFTDAPSPAAINGQIRTTKSTQPSGASVIQELWMQDGVSYIRIGSTNDALTSFTWVGGEAHGWRKVYDSSNRPTAQEAGAMPVSFEDLADQNINIFNLTKVGIYAQRFNANATVTNGYPVGAAAGVLEVLPGPYADTNGAVQRYTNHTLTYSWTRYSSDGSTWSDWSGLPTFNIGTTTMSTLQSFDWQHFDFTTGASYLTNYTGWKNNPVGATYPTDYSVTISVDTINDSATVIEVTTSSNTTANEHYHLYKVLIVGNKGARTFTVRKVHTSAQPVPISEGGTGATNADAALTALGGADIVTSGSDITLLSKANPARDKNIRINANNNDIRTVGADGTVARFYNDKTYRPTAADFGGLFVDDGNEVNFPTAAGESTLYFNYRNVGSEINKISFNNGKSQINGYCDIDVANIKSTGNITSHGMLTNSVVVDTVDGNEVHTPNGITYLGLRDGNGNANHYFRGKGMTYVDTLQGMSVWGGPVFARMGVNVNSKPYGTYDHESMAGWDTSLPTNHLRKFRAHGSASIYHEAVIEEHSDPRASGGISWWTGNGPETFLASINKLGGITARSFKTYGESVAVQLDCEANQASYMKGVNGGKDLWILGKLGDQHAAAFYMYHPTAALTIGMDLYPDYIQHAVHGNATTRTYRDFFRVDGASWSRNNSHSYADQWGQTAPVYVEYGSVPGDSDYYPIVRANQAYAGHGYTTSVDLGIIRNGVAGRHWGEGVIRVASAEQGSANFGATYQFSIDGVASFPSLITSSNGIGINTANGLGAGGLSIGDNDTGFQWAADGVIRFVSNSDGAGYFNSYELFYKYIKSDGGFYVPVTLHGSDKGLVRGPVEGGGWEQWRERAAGLLVDCQNADTSAHTVWKATHWGAQHIACMDVHAPAGGQIVRMVVGGAIFNFHANGVAQAGAWENTSDITLKTKISKLSDMNSLNIVDKIDTINYAFKDNEDKMMIGYSAQNLEGLIPNVVSSNKKEVDSDEVVLSVNYGAMSSFNTSCIKELKTIVEDQQKQIDELKKLVEALISK